MSKNIIKIFILCLSTMFLSCGGDKKDSKKQLEFGVSMPNFDDVFLSILRKAMESKAEELGIELSIEDSKGDIAKQLEHVENFVSKGVDGIIIMPIDSEASEKMTNKTVEAGIPLVYMNRKPSDHFKEYKGEVAFVGSDEDFAGEVQMKGLAEAMNSQGNVVIMLGELGHEGTRGRTRGVKKIVEQNPDIKIIEEQTAEWQRKDAIDLMNDWLSKGETINAVAANNDEMAIGAILAIEKAGKVPNQDIFVGGVDATPAALDMMDQGKMTVTVFQDAKGQGSGGIETLVKMINKEEVPSIVWVPFLPVTQENYKEFMNK